MKVLLTGASGFVGSHILDALRARDITVTLLLRPSSGRELIAHHLPGVEVRNGSITDPASLPAALEGISHVIHCAGATKASRKQDFYEINQIGTRNVVTAANAKATPLKRLLQISSLAVTGPATAAKPARETDPLKPLSDTAKASWRPKPKSGSGVTHLTQFCVRPLFMGRATRVSCRCSRR